MTSPALQSVQVERYRGLKELHVNDLSRINLIAGKNNTGKTALLESIFLQLGPGQPHLATSFSHRGEGRSRAPILPMGLRYADEWAALFYDRDVSRPIELRSTLNDGVDRHLHIFLRESPVQLFLPHSSRTAGQDDEGSATTTQETPVELAYQFTTSKGIEIDSVATASVVGTGGFIRERLQVSRTSRDSALLPRATLLATDRQPKEQVAQQFSDIRDARLDGPIEDILRELDPRLRRLEIRVESRRPELAADLGLKQLVPLRMMGEGVSRVVEILLAIFKAPGGVVLVDELENGLHYSVLEPVWKALAAGARTSSSQVVATTHSWECLAAAHRFFELDGTYDFGLHRLDRVDDRVEVTTFDRESLGAALSLGWEVR